MHLKNITSPITLKNATKQTSNNDYMLNTASNNKEFYKHQ